MERSFTHLHTNGEDTATDTLYYNIIAAFVCCGLVAQRPSCLLPHQLSILYPSKTPQMRAHAKKYNINIKERYKIAFSSVHKAIFICRRELEHVIAFPWMLRYAGYGGIYDVRDHSNDVTCVVNVAMVF